MTKRDKKVINVCLNHISSRKIKKNNNIRIYYFNEIKINNIFLSCPREIIKFETKKHLE